ncbi:MAG TPA: succinate dehydrogenase cytochrome b subunit, partial [Fibrobacteraceae bacterium]|nr:succinate dehydrogenase cytochrome b subunit [Fibrobacteraceae bacterium]
TSSIGKKQIMGCTGAILAMFILGHMVGNIQLINLDPLAAQASYNAYCELLTGHKAFIYTVEAVMMAVFILHVFLAVTLKLQNKKARGGSDYDVNARKGKKTFATFTMIWSGLFVVFFLVSHLMSLKFGEYFFYQSPDVADGRVIRDMWLTTIIAFADIKFSAFYVVSMFIVGLHLFHAISSAFQTMGIAHQKWTPFIELLGIVYSVVVALGFALIAVASFILGNKPETQDLIEKSRDIGKQKMLEEQKKMEEAEKGAFILPSSIENTQVSYVFEMNGGR